MSTAEKTTHQDSDRPENRGAERTKQIVVLAWMTAPVALFAVFALGSQPTWPVAAGIAALSAMLTAIAFFVLRH